MGKKVTENPKRLLTTEKKGQFAFYCIFIPQYYGQKWAKKVKKGQKWPNNLFSRSLVITYHKRLSFLFLFYNFLVKLRKVMFCAVTFRCVYVSHNTNRIRIYGHDARFSLNPLFEFHNIACVHYHLEKKIFCTYSRSTKISINYLCLSSEDNITFITTNASRTTTPIWVHYGLHCQVVPWSHIH